MNALASITEKGAEAFRIPIAGPAPCGSTAELRAFIGETIGARRRARRTCRDLCHSRRRPRP